MINKPILELIYEAAHIQRWNDHMRPSQGFTELDKQAHKMIFAYVIARFEEDERKAVINWPHLIEGGIFEFLHRIVLTDIKPPIFHAMMKESGEKLNRWVLAQLHDTLKDIEGGFLAKFEKYLLDPQYSALEKKILKASHYLATNWEFNIVYHLNQTLYGVEQIKEAIEGELETYSDLAGVQNLSLVKKTRNFLDLVGQLRFQQRWTKSPRIPATSVMGHMLVVAILSYLCSIQVKACDMRVKNNFFAGLFHDLPEVLTRDIVSPVKRSVEGLEDLIKTIENRQIAERILPLLPESWHRELKYFIEDEFASKVIVDGAVRKVSEDELSTKFNEDRFSPVDGEVIKACDHLAAYMEAYLSVSHGVTSNHLQSVLKSLPLDYKGKKIADIDFGKVYEYLNENSRL
jgi:putative hydrolase of HD superfamily